jgi:hypothetical protein
MRIDLWFVPEHEKPLPDAPDFVGILAELTSEAMTQDQMSWDNAATQILHTLCIDCAFGCTDSLEP